MYVKTRLGRWFYEERGAGKETAIVLWPSLLCDGGMWTGQIEPLSKLGRVIVFDPPGHGRSEPPPRFTLWDNASAAVDALDALGVQRAIWIGLSWGGMIGMRLAIAHGARVKALGLLSTNANAETRLNRLKYTVLSQLIRPAGIPKPLFLKAVAPLYFARETMKRRPELAERMYARVAGWPPSVIARVVRAVAISRDDVLGGIAAIRAPAIVMHGDDDRAIPFPRAEAIAARLPRATLHVVRGAGHLSALEQPAAVNAELTPFVEEHLRSN